MAKKFAHYHGASGGGGGATSSTTTSGGRPSLLKRDLLLLTMMGIIVFINFASLSHQHLVTSTQSSALLRHLELSRTTPNTKREGTAAANAWPTAVETGKRAPTTSTTRALGLLDFDFIRSHVLLEAPWAESHGSDHHHFLGAGMLYYSFAYAFQCRTIVVLGSGGGFVPRLLRQAQRDLERSRLFGQRTQTDNVRFRLILIDAHLPQAGWGATFYAENDKTVMRRDFADIRYIIQTTDEAFELLKAEGVEIDYLHVDADHSFAQSHQDFINYASLLSPRGVVSFHDTCQNATRHCSTGVPDTLREIQKQPDAHGLQFLDAHYLYRGIAFAIPKNAPALEGPKSDRWNFCQNNAASLRVSSHGFDNHGSLSTLGAFYDCQGKYNVTQLGQPCPAGFRRSQIKKETCVKCIPGLNGKDCSGNRYHKDRRSTPDLPYENHADLRQRQRLIAAWLADHDIQHLFEINSIPVSKRLYHPIQSAVAADPRMETPHWSDDGDVPILRFLPVRYKDVMKDGDYEATVELDQTDGVVCLDCQRNLKEFSEILRFANELPRLRLMILESHVGTKFLVNVTRILKSTWDMESEIVMGSPRLEREYPNQPDMVRHLILFTRKEQANTMVN